MPVDFDHHMARSKGGYWVSGRIEDLPSGEKHFDGRNRKRPTRYQPSNFPSVDVHGILFAIIVVVFIVHPLAQMALGR